MVAVSLKKFFFFKQKTAYEISHRDWSSDVCSSDLVGCFSVIDQVNDTIVSTESFGKVPIDNDNERRTGRYRESEARDGRLISSLRGPALKQL